MNIQAIIKFMLYTIAGVALLTGLNVVIGGAAAIPGATTAIEASVDNELRFFAVFWLAYGSFSFWVARNIEERQQFIIFIACNYSALLAIRSIFVWIKSGHVPLNRHSSASPTPTPFFRQVDK
jgi:hypothetical protein